MKDKDYRAAAECACCGRAKEPGLLFCWGCYYDFKDWNLDRLAAGCEPLAADAFVEGYQARLAARAVQASLDACERVLDSQFSDRYA